MREKEIPQIEKKRIEKKDEQGEKERKSTNEREVGLGETAWYVIMMKHIYLEDMERKKERRIKKQTKIYFKVN